MKLENQVVSLDLAKRLKELGVKQESYFYWINDEIIPTSGYEYREGGYADEEEISAFTVAELGEMLPYEIEMDGEIRKLEYVNRWGLGKDNWCDVSYMGEKDWRTEVGDTEANTRAKMLIYLLENGLISNPIS